MNIKMTTSSQLSTTEAKKTQTEQTSRSGTESQNGDHMEGYQGQREEKMREKVEAVSSINGRQKTDRGMLRIVEEMEKTKNLYVQPMGLN